MLSLRRWVTVLADVGRTKSFVINPLKEDRSVSVRRFALDFHHPFDICSCMPVKFTVYLPCWMSSCTSGLALTIPIWSVTNGQPFDTDIFTCAAV